MTLAEIKAKYRIQGGKYEPNPCCKACKGTGEKVVKRTGEMTFCVCLFVAPDMSNMAVEMLSEFASKQLAKMRENE